MNTQQRLSTELEHEYNTTRKFLDRFPEGKNDYAPHEKNMKQMPLASHVAEIFAWPELIMNTEVLDFGKGDYKPVKLNTREELIASLDEAYAKGKKALDAIQEDQLEGRWGLAHNGHSLADWSKYEAIRHSLNQITHHRAQLGMYYRLQDIPLPGSYGPSADDESFG